MLREIFVRPIGGNKKQVLRALAVLAATSLVAATALAEGAGLISLVRLVAVPEQYDGQLVQTMGVITFEPRLTMLYISPSDAKHAVMPNGIVVEFTGGEIDLDYARQFDGQFVFVRGGFRSTKDEYRNLPAGIISSIEEIYGEENWNYLAVRCKTRSDAETGLSSNSLVGSKQTTC